MANPNLFPNIEGSELVSQSWMKLLQRDASVKKQFAATEFPDVTEDDVGTPCFREDEQKWYIFTGLGELNQPVWWCPFDTINASEVIFTPTGEFPSGAKTVESALNFLSNKEIPNSVTLPPESKEYVSDGVKTEYDLQKTTSHKETVQIYFSGVRQSPSTYELNSTGDKIVFNEAPAYGEPILIQETATVLEYDLMPLEASYTADNQTTFVFPAEIASPRVVQINVAGKILQTDEYTVSGRNIILNSPVTGKVQIITVYKGQLKAPAAGTVGSMELKDGSVTESKLAMDSVTNTKIINSAVTTAKIMDKNVTTDKIADGAVTADKIVAGAIDESKLSSVLSGKFLGVNKVSSEMLQDSSVVMAKLGQDVVTKINEASANVTDAGTNIKGVVKLATAEEVKNKTGGNKVITSDVLNEVAGDIGGGGESTSVTIIYWE